MSAIKSNLAIIETFPDFKEPGFSIEAYNNFFKTHNIIINASSTDVFYAEHWGCFSIKCAFNGDEFYKMQNRLYRVNDDNFLLLNNGQYYSSYIYSKSLVESFTLNFTNAFINTVAQAYLQKPEKNFDNSIVSQNMQIEFVERFYKHNNNNVSNIILKIKKLVKNFNSNYKQLLELYYELAFQLLLLQKSMNKEINKVDACKYATRKELYKRLHYAKDFIDSCYNCDITLDELAKVSMLNAAYFLREFKKLFLITPYQYLIQTRLREASHILATKNIQIAEVCSSIGYEDVCSFTKLFKNYFGITPEQYKKSFV